MDVPAAVRARLPLKTVRPASGDIREALRQNREIRSELDNLEKAANKNIRKTLPWFRYAPGEVVEVLLGDLAAVVSSGDWRPPLERAADRLNRAGRYISEAVRLALRASQDCPTYGTIPSIVWESTPEAEAEWQRIAALPAEHRLFGSGGAIASLIDREGQTVIDLKRMAPDFLKAMLVYAGQCQREAGRLRRILRARDRRFDRLGPMLNFIRDVQSFTGKAHDAVVARLLADAYGIVDSPQQFSPDAIRKIRERHLPS